MPLYDFKCEKDHIFERHVPLKDFAAQQFCDCGEVARRVISTPMISVDSVGYTCPVTGSWIGSKREHNENLKRHGCRVLETGEKEAAAEFRKKADEEFDRKVEATVEKEVEAMPSEKREKLYSELTRGGVDAVVERRAV